jgi:hypothetical protein
VSVRELRGVLKQEGPSLLYIMETKIAAKRMEDLRPVLGFAGCFVVNSEGLRVGASPLLVSRYGC